VSENRLARYLVALLLAVLVLGPLLSDGVRLVTDYLWFGEEGFRSIYLTILKAQISLSGLAGMGFIVVAGVNLLVARAVSRRFGRRVYSEMLDFATLERFSSVLRGVIWVSILLVGYVIGQWATLHWSEFLLARNSLPWGQADPLLGIDLGFYVFQLPFYWFLYHLAFITLVGCAISATFYYLLEGGVWVTPRGPAMAPAVRTHLLVLGAMLFVLLAYRARLAMYGLLYSKMGVIYGAGYTDVHASLPVFWILLALCLLTAAALLFAAARGNWKPAVGGILALAIVGFLGANVYPVVTQWLIVMPNEIDKEQPYIERAIKFTRQAYALDRFEVREFSAVEDLTLDDMRANEATIRNVRLWDHKPLLTTFAQLQEIRTYYDFERVDNDRYWVNGDYRQLSLSPRELSSDSLPQRTWINEHLTFTHGYGLCQGPVNESTSEGLPELFIKDIPPVSTGSISITRPEIYYGELTNDYCFVRTKAQEFDYPSGDQNVYTRYAGQGGIPVRSIWRRLLFALRFGEPKILLSTDIQPESRLMIYRRVLQRASRLTPFLYFDRDPYIVISKDGSLDWILDGYTTSQQFPYSDPTPQLGNYIRNSVKATVSAYDGRVHFYVADPTDPLIQVYSRLFPGVFEPLEAMPEDLRAHIRYPEDIFSIQARKYAKFHMTDPRVFYNQEDLWRVAQSAIRGAPAPMTPYYTIMKLAGVGKAEEFILMVPFTPARKDNMIAWMAARCDPPNYGKVLVFTFPKQKLIYGPQQIESRIDQDTGISQQLTLWGQGGSQVIRGTLLVIPVLNSVLYVEPLYLAAEAGGGLPQLKRVLVAYSNHVVMEPTLEGALSRIFGGSTSAAPSPASTARAAAGAPQPAAGPATSSPDLTQLIREANQHYERAQQLLRQGDFAGYGEEVRQLGDVLKRLAAQQGQ
jgi:uncharacterized membrane protein (UPF0182 family)